MLICKYTSKILLLIFVKLYFSEGLDIDFSCKLHWIPEGHGNIPTFAISPTTSEYVVRVSVLLDGMTTEKWRIGRLLVHDGRAYVPILGASEDEHTVFVSDTYEVLTNPDNCILEWLAEGGGELPRYAIPAEVDDVLEEYVGRGMVAGFGGMGGSIHPEGSGLFVPYEGKVYRRRYYEVLISRYPPLMLELSDFFYPNLDFRVLDQSSTDVLIGNMELVAEVPNSQQNFPVSHSKIVKERLIFEEDGSREWSGVQNLTVDLDLWFGGDSVAAAFLDLQNTRIVYERERELKVDRSFTISTSGKYQICSSYTRLEKFALKFEALAKATALHMTKEHVKEILLRSQRNIVSIEGSDVLVKIYGTLRGSLATGVKASQGPLEQFAPCASLIRKSRISHNHGERSH